VMAGYEMYYVPGGKCHLARLFGIKSAMGIRHRYICGRSRSPQDYTCGKLPEGESYFDPSFCRTCVKVYEKEASDAPAD